MSKRPSRGVSSGIGSPTRMAGRNGDLTIRKTKEGKILYVKEHGSWHPINTGVDVAQMKKDVDRLIRSVNTLRNDNNPFPIINALKIRKNVATATVDPKITFTIAGTDKFSIGVDDSDSDKFIIANSAALGTNNRFAMTTAGAITLGGNLDVGANTLTVNSVEIVGADGVVNKAAVEDSNEWDQAFTRRITIEDSDGGTSSFPENALMTMGDSDGELIAEKLISYTAGVISFDGTGARAFQISANTADAQGYSLSVKGGGSKTGGTNDLTGGALDLHGGAGVGTGNGGNINFKIALPGGSTGNSVNSYTTEAYFDGSNGNLFLDNNVYVHLWKI